MGRARPAPWETILPYAVKGARALGHLALSPADACARKHAYAIFEGHEKDGLYTSGFAAQTRDSVSVCAVSRRLRRLRLPGSVGPRACTLT